MARQQSQREWILKRALRRFPKWNRRTYEIHAVIVRKLQVIRGNY